MATATDDSALPTDSRQHIGSCLVQFVGQTTKPKNLILVLVGNAHAMQALMFGYDPAAMYLPRKEILSLEVTDRRGESWFDSGKELKNRRRFGLENGFHD